MRFKYWARGIVAQCREWVRLANLSPSGYDQPAPKVTRADVDRIVRREFAEQPVQEVFGIIDAEESPRVQLAALKIAGGDIDRLRLILSHYDYRDLLAEAEWPSRVKGVWTLGERRRQKRRIEAQWKQYSDWLRR